MVLYPETSEVQALEMKMTFSNVFSFDVKPLRETDDKQRLHFANRQRPKGRFGDSRARVGLCDNSGTDRSEPADRRRNQDHDLFGRRESQSHMSANQPYQPYQPYDRDRDRDHDYDHDYDYDLIAPMMYDNVQPGPIITEHEKMRCIRDMQLSFVERANGILRLDTSPPCTASPWHCSISSPSPRVSARA